ncbi:flagellar hook-associated protein 2 [Bacillus cihuensis]|uniref:flagellar hook-associated protein 2 n=1 Tax=Bacillus cihuensis TaxID=1208599 RepID=UPI000406FB95|nr:flagellar hook-associated protein 2 [Bacillus cihuensis]
MVRVSGLASGMDIDELVKSMMQAERIPMDKLTQKKQYTEWQRDDYRSMNTALLELDRLITDGVGMQKSFNKKTVTVSNPDTLSVRNINSTTDFSGTIEVEKLATAANMISTEKAGIKDPTVTLSGSFVNKSITITAINKDGVLEASKPITFEATDTLDSFIAKINSQSNVTVFYDKVSEKFSFTAKNTGDGEIVLSGDEIVNDLLKMEGVTVNRGVDAILKYNGLVINRPSNTFTINGAEITLKKVTTDPVTFSSTADVDAILDTVTKFVEKYNEVIEKIKNKTNETKYRSFAPLTAEQKKELTEDEVKLWEEKAKSGTLKNDSTLKSLLTTMRSSLYTSVSGVAGVNALAAIGISTTSNYLDGGKLTINEDKLRAAIAEDPNAIYQLFMANGEKQGEQGLARRLRSDLKTAMTTITEKAGKASSVNNTFTIGKLLNNLDSRISTFEAKLTKLESRYYSQFTAMEKAIQKANSQSASLMQYFS